MTNLDLSVTQNFSFPKELKKTVFQNIIKYI